MSERREVWKFSLVFEATEEDAERVSVAMQRALCPDENHDGLCAVPWTMMQCRFEDLDDDERRMWEDDFANDRRLHQDAGEFSGRDDGFAPSS